MPKRKWALLGNITFRPVTGNQVSTSDKMCRYTLTVYVQIHRTQSMNLCLGSKLIVEYMDVSFLFCLFDWLVA